MQGSADDVDARGAREDVHAPLVSPLPRRRLDGVCGVSCLRRRLRHRVREPRRVDAEVVVTVVTVAFVVHVHGVRGGGPVRDVRDTSGWIVLRSPRHRGGFAPLELLFRVFLAKLSHARLRPRDVLVPRRVSRRLVRLERVLPLDLPADHLLHAQALLRRLSLQLFQLGDVVLAPVLIRSFRLGATLLHRGRQRLAQALFHVLRRHHDGYEPRQTPGFDRAHDGGHLPPVQPAEDDASLRSKLASLVKSLVRPGRLPVGFADLQRRVQGPAQVLLRNGRDGHVVAAELVEQLAHPRDLLGSKSREEHRGGPLGFLVNLIPAAAAARVEAEHRRLLVVRQVHHRRREPRARVEARIGAGSGAGRRVGSRVTSRAAARGRLRFGDGAVRRLLLPRHRLPPLLVLDVLERVLLLGRGLGSGFDLVPVVVEEPVVVSGRRPLALHLADPVVLRGDDDVAVHVEHAALLVPRELAKLADAAIVTLIGGRGGRR